MLKTHNYALKNQNSVLKTQNPVVRTSNPVLRTQNSIKLNAPSGQPGVKLTTNPKSTLPNIPNTSMGCH